MENRVQLPQFVHRLGKDERFTFDCHSGVSCFTQCCRMLELALTPYDVLRLRRGAGCSSSEMLEKYIIMEHEPGEPFPRFYLTMVDDGRASCVFVGRRGCTVYDHRPSACRSYPLGRAVMRVDGDRLEEHFVLIKEHHCQGFSEARVNTAATYGQHQGLAEYNHFNDRLAAILQHDAVRNGFIPSVGQVDKFILSLYDLDTFKDRLLTDRLGGIKPDEQQMNKMEDDRELLGFAIDWLCDQLFSGL
ncbi:YkgJ family cysteine cluster protein [Desulforhopalus singaporensis]|uniref:Uncharacterized protein n=1 Tax=Desulforhopalus singaporensis TaxID=91360 RepID=A0A1H0JTH6_9BACT|nr:YkgJ family cysteine cluster protein [Desulforhopalus singaporensis]SDO46721.1 hypothetical protein SAMN05660330_00307 [Desulforhopalus singaporensis]